MTKKLIVPLFCLISGLLFCARPASSQVLEQENCPVEKVPVEVHITVRPGNIFYNHEESVREITHVAAKNGTVVSDTIYHHVVGLTVARYIFQLSASGRGIEYRPTQSCVRLTNLNLVVGYSTLIVYINKKYSKGSCPYQETYKHEMEHVRRYREALDRYAPILQQQLMSLANTTGPGFGNHKAIKPILADMSRQLNDKLQPYLKEFQRYANQLQIEWDSPQNYSQTQARCKDW